MGAAAVVSCAFLAAACLAARTCQADGQCTTESLSNGKMPPELKALVGQGEGSGLVGTLCSVPAAAPWTVMFGDNVLQCVQQQGQRVCTVPAINGISISVESSTAEPRVSTANVKPSQDRLRPLLNHSSVRYIAPNCRSFGTLAAPAAVQYSQRTGLIGTGLAAANTEACERHDSAQWGIADACIPATNQNAAAPKVVAILDAGVDCVHPAIKGRFDNGAAPTGKRRCTAGSGTNYVFPTLPADSCTTADDPFTSCEAHGTGVAGIIASSAPQVPGIDPRAKLLSMRVLQPKSDLEFVQPWTKVATAILDSRDKGAHIINISANWYRNYPWLAAAVDKVTEDHRHLVVGAARHDEADRPPYPAAYAKCNAAVIGVSDILRNPNQSPPYLWGSGDHDPVYMVAAGHNVLTSYSDHNTLGLDDPIEPMYRPQGGSSFAAPHVTGAAARVWSTQEFENCRAEGVRALLECSARMTSIDGQDMRKRLHVGCLFAERNSQLCSTARQCIATVKTQLCSN